MTDRSQAVLIRNVGIDGLLVSFGDGLSEPANRAALAFRDALERAGWDGIEETTTSLVSTYLRFDPLALDRAALTAQVQTLLAERDWHDTPLPEGRKLWRIPTVYSADHAPQLAEAAELAGVSVDQAIRHLSTTPLRVQTIGFAPGQPYLGSLPPEWDIPRQTALTKQVPMGAVTVAIRQIVLFSVAAPTGWRHVGQTALQLFRPDADEPFVLRPGDEALFEEAAPEALAQMRNDPDGGATWTALT